ncbi:MAG: DUF3575 domain-containing protein [Cryomorphaceae bacterium]|nr:DUF3575 domain-containing protein [Cryomorphaceae bacterium]
MRSKLLISLVVFAAHCSAQSHVIKLDAFDFLSSRISVSYEHLVGSQTSFQITSGVLLDYSKQTVTEQSSVSLINEDISTGWRILPEFRYYLNEMTNMKAPAGAHINISGRYEMNDYSLLNDMNNWKRNEQIVGLGAGLGMQWFFVQNFGLELDFKIFTFYRFSEQSGTMEDGLNAPFEKSEISREFDSMFFAKIVYGF